MSRKLTIWALAALLIPGSAALAAFLDDVLLKGLSTNKSVVIVVSGTEHPVGTVGTNGEISIPLDAALSAAIDPNKNYAVVFREGCNRYEIVVETEKDRRCRDEERDESGKPCGRCVAAGWIRNGKFEPAGPATAAAAAPRGFSIGGFAFASSKQTFITNAEETALPTINDRFVDAGYDRYNVLVDEKGSGFGWGGGVNMAWGNVPVGVRVGFTHEDERSSPTQDVNGERDAAGLRFQQSGDSRLSSTTLFLGPTVHLPAGIVVTGGPAVSWWQTDLSQTGSLRALCPNPCMLVRTDDVRTAVDGTDVGFHLGAEFYPRGKWFGFYASFMRVTLDDVYDPTDALALPANWTDVNVFVGVSLRTGGGRPRTLFR
jgi:hypothetical protein